METIGGILRPHKTASKPVQNKITSSQPHQTRSSHGRHVQGPSISGRSPRRLTSPIPSAFWVHLRLAFLALGPRVLKEVWHLKKLDGFIGGQVFRIRGLWLTPACHTISCLVFSVQVTEGVEHYEERVVVLAQPLVPWCAFRPRRKPPVFSPWPRRLRASGR